MPSRTALHLESGAKYYGNLDHRHGYWQVENDPDSANKTACITQREAFKFKVFLLGLSNALAGFQRLINLVMIELNWEQSLVFLDDIVISATFEEHLERLRNVFDKLKWTELKLEPSKCRLFQIKEKFMAGIVSEKRDQDGS